MILWNTENYAHYVTQLPNCFKSLCRSQLFRWSDNIFISQQLVKIQFENKLHLEGCIHTHIHNHCDYTIIFSTDDKAERETDS